MSAKDREQLRRHARSIGEASRQEVTDYSRAYSATFPASPCRTDTDRFRGVSALTDVCGTAFGGRDRIPLVGAVEAFAFDRADWESSRGDEHS